jgi:hypothetical protein
MKYIILPYVWIFESLVEKTKTLKKCKSCGDWHMWDICIKNKVKSAGKMLTFILALSFLGGCNAVDKLTGKDSHESNPTVSTVEDFSGTVTGPSPILLAKIPNNQTYVLEVFACTNGCVDVDFPAYQIPVYTTSQSTTAPYAIWSYAYPTLQVSLENYTSTDTVNYLLRSR